MVIRNVDGKNVEELALDAEDAIRDGMGDTDSVEIGNGLSGAVEMIDAGHSYVYDVRDGDRSKVNNNMLRTQLTKTDTDVTSPHYGKRVFTTENLWAKGIKPTKGTFKCFLHRDAPDRAKHDALGFAVCPAGNLASPSNQESHAKRTHKAEWASIEADATRVRQEKRDELDTLNLAMLRKSLEADAPTTDPAPAPAAGASPVPAVAVQGDWTASSGTCQQCDWAYGGESTKKGTIKTAYYKHNKEHAE